MGTVRMGPPTELILQLKARYDLRVFIETGTYCGDTAAWAACHFDSVTTIEYSREIHQEAVGRHGKIQNINFILGDSRAVLKTIVPKLSNPAVFWLDSHWSGGQTYGANDECPLLEEIRTLHMQKCTHFLFIDDARLFTSPPPRPHRVDEWPSIDEVIEAVKSCNDDYYIVLIEDVIVAAPNYAMQLVAGYCQEINTKAWQVDCKRLTESEITQGCRLIGRGLLGIAFRLRASLRRFTSMVIKN
jgi:hypothetical protein